jgi:nucleotidyltransferase/DNA polymerase involved in DNA repair
VLPADWHLLEPELQRGVVLALQLRAAVKASLGLTVSCGVAPGKLLARLVTPLHKPDAVTGG